MISCLIVDDEQAAIDLMTTFVKQTPFLSLVASTTNPIEAIGIVQSQPIDLVFVDIQMPQISGLNFAKILQNKTKVIFTTAYSEFAIEAFELEAIDYLTKPIPYERFLKAVQKLLNQKVSIPINPNLKVTPPEEEFVFVKTETKGKMIRVNYKDICYAESLKNYITIHTNSEQVTTLMTMKDLEDRLPTERFMRIHKSYIVALDKVRLIDGNQILLQDVKGYIPLGESFRNDFFDMLDSKVLGGKNKK